VPGYRFGYVAAPFFIVLLSLPSRSCLAERARRLLLPFLLWSVIQALARIAPAPHGGDDLLGWWKTSMLLTGTSTHLWFLPFAALLALVQAPQAHPVYQWRSA
jgi:fucose 4-O-acetylase-like acetyltransferase